MKKRTALRAVAVLAPLLLLTLALLCVHFYRGARAAGERLARQNAAQWGFLLDMTRKIETNVQSAEDIQEWALYQNAALYGETDFLSPAFSGSASLTFRFLPSRYDPLIQDLAAGRIPDSCLQEAFALYRRMNGDLEAICREAVERTDGGADMAAALALLDARSEPYRELCSRIEAYCDTYGEELTALYSRF